MDPEALSLIEFSSIARGTKAVDALIKKAPVEVVRVGTLQPGKLAVLFCGDVASVDAAHEEAIRVGADTVADEVMLPLVEASVYRAALGQRGDWAGDTLGVVEVSSLAGTIEAADAAVKGAEVRVVSMRLGDELGGKGLAHLVGEQHDVEAALELAQARAQKRDRQLQVSITPRLDGDLRSRLSATTRFWGEG